MSELITPKNPNSKKMRYWYLQIGNVNNAKMRRVAPINQNKFLFDNLCRISLKKL